LSFYQVSIIVKDYVAVAVNALVAPIKKGAEDTYNLSIRINVRGKNEPVEIDLKDGDGVGTLTKLLEAGDHLWLMVLSGEGCMDSFEYICAALEAAGLQYVCEVEPTGDAVGEVTKYSPETGRRVTSFVYDNMGEKSFLSPVDVTDEKVVIVVQGGIAEVKYSPEGVEVEIVDLDNLKDEGMTHDEIDRKIDTALANAGMVESPSMGEEIDAEPLAFYGNEKEDEVMACWKVTDINQRIWYALSVIPASDMEEDDVWGYEPGKYDHITQSIAERDAYLVDWLQSVIQH